MKLEYTKPSVEIENYMTVDVVTTSIGSGADSIPDPIPTPGDNEINPPSLNEDDIFSPF